MKVAAYQAPLDIGSCAEALDLIQEQVTRCEALGVAFLCCPEGALGGLADYVDHPAAIALEVAGGQLLETLAPLASERVTTILGFTEIDADARLYNSAAVFHRGAVIGVYRKLHPAINRSVYAAGHETPVFTVDTFTFGILICRDSTFAEPARRMAAQGATALFVPTNNGMPVTRGGEELIAAARGCDIARAKDNGVSVIRADVAGRTAHLVSYGSSAIVNSRGSVLAEAERLEPTLIVADIDISCQSTHAERSRAEALT
ncbi:MAG: carbon-nitrogen hydrolase family protein [bacterium]